MKKGVIVLALFMTTVKLLLTVATVGQLTQHLPFLHGPLALNSFTNSPNHPQVLAATDTALLTPAGIVTFNVDTIFNGNVTATKNLEVQGQLIAPNLINSIKAGQGLTVSAGANPTITNTGVVSLAGQTGTLNLSAGDGISIDGLKITNTSQGITSLSAGSGISVSGNTITNSDTGSSQKIFKTIAVSGQSNITATTNTDTLTFAAGTGVALTTDATGKVLTIASSTGSSGPWTESAGLLYPTTTSDLVGIGTSAPTSTLTVNASVTAQGSAPSVSTAKPALELSKTHTGFGENTAYIQSIWNPSTDLAGISGLDVYTQTSPTNTHNMTGTLVGGTFRSEHLGSGTAATVTGLQAFGENNGGGSTTTVRGLLAEGIVNNSSTITNAYGLKGLTALNGGTITNSYGGQFGDPLLISGTITYNTGISIEDMASGTNNTNLLIGTTSAPTGNFSLYNSSTYDNYFAGNVGIGTSTPQSKLDVNGSLSIAGTAVLDSSRHLSNITSVSTNLIPTTTDTYDLGSSSNEWNNIYGKNIYVSGNIIAGGTGGGGGTIGFIQRNSGAVEPTNITDALLVGSTATTSAIFNVSGTATTTGTGSSFNFNSLSSGTGLSVNSTSGSFLSGKLFNIDQTSTYTTVSTYAGNLFNINRLLTINDSSTPVLTFDAVSTKSQANSTTATWSHTVGTGNSRILIVEVVAQAGGVDVVPTSVTYGGQSLTLYTSNNLASLWYLLNPSSGTANIVATAVGVNTYFSTVATSWSNVAQDVPFGTATTAAGSGSDSGTQTISGTATTDYVIDLFGGDTSPTYTQGAGQTLRGTTANVGGPSIAASTKPGATTSTTMSWTTDNFIHWSYIGVALKGLTAPTMPITGSLASLTSNCTQILGVCSDSSNLLTLTQSLSSATGSLLNISNSGHGSALNIAANTMTTSTGIAATFNGLTTGKGLSITSSSTAGGGSGSSYLINLSRSGANANASHTAYGLYSTVTNTGTTSTNIAGYFSASGATTNLAAVFANGNVAIGESGTGVNNTLKVDGSLCVKSASGACAGNTAGTIYATTTTISSADYAENYISSQQLQPGEVVVKTDDGNTSSVSQSTTTYANKVLGIVSTNPGVTINSDASTDAQHPYKYAIALSGRVPLKVSTENGAIQPGDFLTSSSVTGVAMKATHQGYMVAKALEAYNGQGVGTIMAYVSVGYADPNDVLARLQFDKNGNLITGQQQPQTLEMLTGRVDTLETQYASISAQLDTIAHRGIDLSHNETIASLSATLADTVTKVTDHETRIASLEAKLNNQVLGIGTQSAQLTGSNSATLSALTVTGTSNLNDVFVAGKINNGLLSIDGLHNNAVSINSLAVPLKIQDTLSANVDFMAGQVVIDTTGNVTAKSITVKKVNVDTTDVTTASLGEGTIRAGQTSVVISTTAVTNASRIFVTATTDTDEPLIVVSKTAGTSFTVKVKIAQGNDVKFSWWIVN